jgi:TolB-like protein/DNA-binding winged helix-turn-helix (wHTH) protein
MKQPATAEKPLPPRFRIDDLVVEVGMAHVSRGGERLALPGLSYDLLLVLARSAPDLVTHDELMTRVWQGVIVSPETVAQRVKLLRDALGDDPREPRYVAGVRGRGYRLLHPVVPLDSAAAPPSVTPSLSAHAEPPSATAAPPATPTPGDPSAAAPADEPPAPAPSRSRPRLLVAGIVALAAVLAAALLAVRPAWLFAPAPRMDEVAVDVVGEPARTVAVLPFQNLSPDPANEYIGLGVAEMVLNRLAGSPTLFVIARSSSFAFEDRNVDARAIGRDLGAKYLVEGSVQRDGEQLRVTAQVVDAQTGRQLKVLRFDRTMNDLFAMQDEIAAEVARALDVAVPAAGPGTQNLAAHLEYLQGLAALGRWQSGGASDALRHFVRAQQLDPAFAAAYVGEAEARRQATVLENDDIEGVKPELAKLADRALQLDPNLGPAYVLRSLLQQDVKAQEADLRRGIALAPNYGEGYYRLATLLLAQPARRAEGLDLLDRAIAVDPMRLRYRQIRAVVGFEQDGDVGAMEARLLEMTRIAPTSTLPYEQLARMVASNAGRFADGVRYAERGLALDASARDARLFAAELYFAAGDFAAGRAVMTDSAYAPAMAIASAVAAGDMRTAGRLALTPAAPDGGRAVPPSAIGSVFDVAIVLAVLDESLRTRDYARGLRVLREQHCVPRDPRAGCISIPTLMSAISIGQLLLASGDRAAGEAQLGRVLDFLGDEKDTWALPPLARARIHVLLGREDEALRALEAVPARLAIAWWAVLEREPTFDPLRADPRFQAVLAESRRHAAAERAKLEAMRAEGAIPRRVPPPA